MKLFRLIVCFLIVCSFFTAQAQEKYSKVKFYPPKENVKRSALMGLLQIDHFYNDEDGGIIAEISQADVNKLKATGNRFEIMIDNVEADLLSKNKTYFDNRKRGLIQMDGSPVGTGNTSRVAIEQTGKTAANVIATPAAFQVQSGSPNLGGYYTFAQMNTAMNALVAAYPALASKTSLGTTLGGNNIWCIKISDNVATDEANEPEVLFIGLQHAREAIGGSSMIFLMQYLCEQYSVDPKIKDLVNNREIYIIPCMNADGWEYNRTTSSNGGGNWRKNRKVIASGQYGVDLNRNWGIDWANCPGGDLSCGDPSAVSTNDTYWGTAAFSELETQAIRAFVKTRNFVSMIDQHAYGPYYSLPFGRPSLHTGSDTLTIMDQQYYTQIPSLMGRYNGMRAGNSIQSVGYEVAGGVKDWMLKGEIGVGTKGKVYGMTGEGGYGAAAATFWPPAAQIINLCRGMTFQNLQLLFAAGSYVDIQDKSDIAVTAINGNFNFSVQRLGIGDAQVTVSLIPLENIQSVGSPVVISSMPVYNQITNGSISYNLFPALGTGQRVKYILNVATGGYTYADTITKFYNPTQLFYDDMETAGSFATNWTSTSDVTDKWAYTALSSFGGTKSITESPASNYTTSSTRTLQYKNTFSLTGSTAAYLTFWTKHRAENFRDKLQVQVSTNGTTWIPVEGSTTVEEPGTLEGSTINGSPALTGVRSDWTNEVYNLSAYNGAAALSLKFVFTSDSDPSTFFYERDEGFYLDNIKVVMSNAVFSNLLPINFIKFYGNLSGKKIGLNWEAVTDKTHNYFEVEKSADAISFTTIGKVTSGAPFNFTDYAPYNGNNYYRIREVDMDGKITYSKIINVPYNAGKAGLLVYPNPVTDLLRVKINDRSTGSVDIKITDVQGRIVYTAADIENTGNEIKINTHSFMPQVYIMKVTGKQGDIIGIERFIKH
ncbi:MAG: M14 family zinc carboxypeptidase [Chitinophagaceae bacterium]